MSGYEVTATHHGKAKRATFDTETDARRWANTQWFRFRNQNWAGVITLRVPDGTIVQTERTPGI